MAKSGIKKIMVLIISLALVTTMTFSMSVVTSSAASKTTHATKITSAKVYDKHYVSIKWNKINKATSYKIAYKVNNDSSKWKYKTVSKNNGKLKLSYKTKYMLKVKVYRKGYKSSEWSKVKYITTKALSKQTKATKITSATVTDQRYVTLKWNKVKNATSYKLAYKVNDGKADWKYKTVKAATGKLKLSYDTKYAFKVRVDSNKYRNSKWSAIKTVSTEKENVYTVSFDPNGGKGEVVTEKIAIGSEYSIPSYDYFNKSGFTRDNYTLTGWNTKADGTGTFYNNGAPLKETVAAGDSVKLYAVWQYNVVPVSKAYAVFDSDNGSFTFFKRIQWDRS